MAPFGTLRGLMMSCVFVVRADGHRDPTGAIDLRLVPLTIVNKSQITR
jgi:hypothetical protein